MLLSWGSSLFPMHTFFSMPCVLSLSWLFAASGFLDWIIRIPGVNNPKCDEVGTEEKHLVFGWKSAC